METTEDSGQVEVMLRENLADAMRESPRDSGES